MVASDEPVRTGYWYAANDDVVPMLHALRSFRRADEEMRRRLSKGMDMNLTDVQAIQVVIAAERRGARATPRLLAEQLGLTTASTTKLLDRLHLSGHLERHANERDRRSVTVTATPHAQEQIRWRLGPMHERMVAVARAVPAESRAAVAGFLTAMTAELEQASTVDPLTPGPPGGQLPAGGRSA